MLRIASAARRQSPQTRQFPAVVTLVPQAVSPASIGSGHLLPMSARSFASAAAIGPAVFASAGKTTPPGVRRPRQSACASPTSEPALMRSRHFCIACAALATYLVLLLPIALRHACWASTGVNVASPYAAFIAAMAPLAYAAL